MSIYHSMVITHQYKTARHELLTSIFNSSIIAREQCIPHVTRAQHVSYLQNFSRHDVLHAFFVLYITPLFINSLRLIQR